MGDESTVKTGQTDPIYYKETKVMKPQLNEIWSDL